jgi:pyruvate decarboxylase
LRDFLAGLASKVQKRPATLVEYQRICSQPQTQQPAKPDAKLKRTEIFRQVQAVVNGDTTVIAETGDSWFNGMALNLPGGARFDRDAVGLHRMGRSGYIRLCAWRIEPSHYHFDRGRVISVHRAGGGADDPAELPVIIFLINNHAYTIEVEIHNCPYNNINNWDYAGLIGAFNAEGGHGRGLRANNGKELEEAHQSGGRQLCQADVDRMHH